MSVPIEASNLYSEASKDVGSSTDDLLSIMLTTTSLNANQGWTTTQSFPNLRQTVDKPVKLIQEQHVSP